MGRMDETEWADWRQGGQSVVIAESHMVTWTELRESRMERA